MACVLGIGGFFFTARDADGLTRWYAFLAAIMPLQPAVRPLDHRRTE